MSHISRIKQYSDDFGGFYSNIEQFGLPAESVLVNSSSSSSKLSPLVKKTLAGRAKEEDDYKLPSRPLQKSSSAASQTSSKTKENSFAWIKLINENPTIALAPPPIRIKTAKLEKLVNCPIAPDSNLHKLIVWVIYIKKVLAAKPETLQSREVLAVIQDEKLGERLSECAECFTHIPAEKWDASLKEISQQIKEAALDMIQIQTHHYFHKSELWQRARSSLERSHKGNTDQTDRELQNITNVVLKEKEATRACVVAKDLAHHHYWISKSGRTWAIPRKHLDYWTQHQSNCTKLLGNKVFFCPLSLNAMTIAILCNITATYAEFCRMQGLHTEERDTISHFTDFNLVRGVFCDRLFDLFAGNKEITARKEVLNGMKNLFQNALKESQWEDLFKLAEKKEISQKDVCSIVLRKKSTYSELIYMAIATANCGEVKVALQLCRNLHSLSAKEQETLPPTLGERVEVYPFVVSHNDHVEKIIRIKICEKCREMWNVFEALHWSLLRSGLSLSAIEQLEK